MAIWNVRLTLSGTGYQVALVRELKRYKIAIAGLTEARVSGLGEHDIWYAVGFRDSCSAIILGEVSPMYDIHGGGLIDFDDVSAAVDGFWSGCRGLSLICRL